MSKGFDVFSVRELRTRTGDLIRHAEEGRLSIITKRGRPVILAMPFDETLLELGAQKTMALALFSQGTVSMGRAAEMAGMKIPGFISLLGRMGMVAVDYPAEELEAELER